jgi:hypothetical protein
VRSIALMRVPDWPPLACDFPLPISAPRRRLGSLGIAFGSRGIDALAHPHQ